MVKPILKNTEFDFSRNTWWAYFEPENGNGNPPKRFGVNDFHYKFQAKMDFGKNDDCREYLVKRAQEYAKKFNDYSEMPEEKILGSTNK